MMKAGSLTALALLATLGSAKAQSEEDCAQPLPFALRRFQHSVVVRAAGAVMRDPYNTILADNLARCDGGSHRLLVCGTFARRNQAGYVDRPRRFFGVFNGLEFTFVAFDNGADQACRSKRLR